MIELGSRRTVAIYVSSRSRRTKHAPTRARRKLVARRSTRQRGNKLANKECEAKPLTRTGLNLCLEIPIFDAQSRMASKRRWQSESEEIHIAANERAPTIQRCSCRVVPRSRETTWFLLISQMSHALVAIAGSEGFKH
jgi:hypothetical protein